MSDERGLQADHVGYVQPTHGPGLVTTFVCNCADCRKITASMFASNFTVRDTHLKHLRGRDNLKAYAQSKTIESGNTMTNYFCSTCGSLMYRVSSGYPGLSILRIGTVDDFRLHETKLRPRVELYVEKRVDWFTGVEGSKKASKGFGTELPRDGPKEGRVKGSPSL